MDTNSNWVARRLTEHGWRLRRTITVLDSVTEIANAVKESLRRRPSLVFTLGGLGPTPDDMTLKGVARALRRSVEVNRSALELVQKFYERMDERTRMTGPRIKMAMLPKGAAALKNPVGTAPGVLLERGPTRIICLPGVPREMEAIFNSSVVPLLEKSGGKAPVETTLRVDGIVESALAPLIASVKHMFPGLYFKSHPRGSETMGRPLIELHIYSLDEKGREKLGEACSYILKRMSELSTR